MKKFVISIVITLSLVVSSWAAETEPVFKFVTTNYGSVNVGAYTVSIPTFADIDNDQDFDLFVGQWSWLARIAYYRNDGTADNAEWTSITSSYNFMEFNIVAAPTLVDIDKDGDLDLFVGRKDGYLSFYRNDGNRVEPIWTFITDRYGWIRVRCDYGEEWGCNGGHASPAFVDIDSDGDYDLFVGGWYGEILFFRNDGTPLSASWIREDSLSLQLGLRPWRATPAFADIDRDGDYDLFVGSSNGAIAYYENRGTPLSSHFALVTSSFKSINVGRYSTPAFVDIDNDGDSDLFVGSLGGSLHFYQNSGLNHIPVANAGFNKTIELQTCAGATIPLDGSMSYDPDGDLLSYVWSWPGGVIEGINPTIILPHGTTTVTLTVTDDKGASSTDTVAITVVDTTPPKLEVAVEPSILWPPNHKYVEVTPYISVVDACIDTTAVKLLSISTNEPDNGNDDGNTTNDIFIENGLIKLRAERSGLGSGRIYTINYTAIDGSGNTTNTYTQVTVPLNGSK